MSQATQNLEEFEFNYSAQAADFASKFEGLSLPEKEQVRDHIRNLFWLNRFNVFNWLMLNGVEIPASLMVETMHPEVGKQTPDKEVGVNGYSKSA